MAILTYVVAAAALGALFRRKKAPASETPGGDKPGGGQQQPGHDKPGGGQQTPGGDKPGDDKPNGGQAPADDDKPADKPAATPPAGGITVNEKQVADAQLLVKLNTIDPSVVPVPTNSRKPGQSDAEWFSNVAFWTAYRSPTSPWVKQYAAGPVKITDGPNGPWASSWKRINAYIVGQLAGQAPADDDKPADKPAATPAPGGLTNNEKQAADAQLLVKLNTIDPSVVPVPTNTRKPGQSDAEWFSNVAFWTAYRSPTSPWVKQYAAGPVKITDGPNGPWASSWKRINAYIVGQLAGQAPADDDKPGDQTGPAAGPITIIEKDAADGTLWLQPDEVDAAFVPVPTNTRKPGQSDAEWFSNVAFWTAYRSPTSPWVKQYAAGPVKITDGPNGPWASSWKRINAYIVGQLAGQAPADDDKPADKPAATPPAGGITVNEKQAADAQLLVKLNTIDPSVVPVPTNTRKPGQSDAEWFSNVAFWTAYRSPTSPWVKQYAAGPVKITDGPNGPWASSWKRINAYIVGQLAGQAPADDDKPADKPAATPPAGALTLLEKQVADAQLLVKLNTIDPSVVPVPTNSRKPGQSDAEWFSNVAFWTAYRSPTSPWVKQYAAGPVKITDGPNGPWASSWKRINAYIVGQLAGQAPADDDKPADKPAATPAPGGLTNNEKQAADAQLLVKLNTIDPSVVPVPTNTRKPGQSDAEWFSNVAFWTAYRSPTSPWVKQYAAGPVKITDGPNGPWASSWKRINAYIVGQLAGQAPADDDKPGDQTGPAAGPITIIEKDAADGTLWLQPDEVDAAFVPVPTNTRKPGQSDAEWFSNVAFWTAYRSPTSPWVKQYAAGPVKITDGPNGPWASSWKRINAYVIGKLGG